MVRRRLTLKRIDPWSVLKFGFVANLSLLAIFLLGFGVMWFFIRQLELIEKACDVASRVAFEQCGINGGNLFRTLLLLGLLGVVTQTGVWVFLSFLYNLIADLVGGLSFSFIEDGPLQGDYSNRGATFSSRAPGAGGATRQVTTPPPTPVEEQPDEAAPAGAPATTRITEERGSAPGSLFGDGR